MQITSGNEDPNYWVNILAIEPTLTSIGTLGVNAGVQPKMQAGQVSINFADHLKSNDPVVLLGAAETLVDVTNEYFDAISGNADSNYFVNWMAFGNT